MHIWCLDHKGYCFSSNIYIKILPTVMDFEIISLIHKINDTDYIIADYDGEISAVSKKISDYLEIDAKNLAQHKLNI